MKSSGSSKEGQEPGFMKKQQSHELEIRILALPEILWQMPTKEKIENISFNCNYIHTLP